MTESPTQQDKPTQPSDAGLRRVLRILTPAELAALLECAENTVTAWRERGTGPKWTRLGRRVYYRHEDVQEWIAEGVMKPKGGEPGDTVRPSQDECFHAWVMDPDRPPGAFKCEVCGALGRSAEP